MLGHLAPLLLPVLWPARRRRARALAAPEKAQRAVLQRIGQAAARTQYARDKGVGFSSYEQFAKSCPLATWDDVAPYAAAQQQGDADALCPGRVRAWEPTSGSSGTKKYIPYNRALLATFRAMFAVWVDDIVRHGPGFSSARFYFSISPAVADQGLDDDRAYMSGLFRVLLGPLFVMPRGIERETDPDRFMPRTAAALLAARKLEIVSVWSPTFLLSVLDVARAAPEAVARAMRDEHKARPALVEAALRAVADGDGTKLWPQLRLVSCWDRGFAQSGAETLRGWFPHAVVQGKGLLLTEGPVTVPALTQGPGQVPCLDQVVLELLDEAGEVHPLWRAKDETAYEVVLTQPGGLLRYRTGDRVRATGRFGQTCGLDFVGRTDRRVDLVGEKLSEQFAAEVLRGLGVEGVFAPRVGEDGYVLLTRDAAFAGRAGDVDDALARAHHYGLARRLGQLSACTVAVCDDPGRVVREAWVQSGGKLGDLKPGPLCRVRVQPPVPRRVSVEEAR